MRVKTGEARQRSRLLEEEVTPTWLSSGQLALSRKSTEGHGSYAVVSATKPGACSRKMSLILPSILGSPAGSVNSIPSEVVISKGWVPGPVAVLPSASVKETS